LKSGGEEFIVSVVEDGVVIRMQSETLEKLVKSLLSGEGFILKSSSTELEVVWKDPRLPQQLQGALVSPIDYRVLSGHYQYGLILNRQFRSQNFVPTSSEWAIRLSSVINMDDGKFPSIFQSRYFEICEHVTVQISATLLPFVAALLAANQRTIVVRIELDSEHVGYDTSQWEALQDEHYVWTLTLDDQLVPFLYNVLSVIPNGLKAELHLSLISTRPLTLKE
jgi:hypothetical protein